MTDTSTGGMPVLALLADIIRCPRCSSAVSALDGKYRCNNRTCRYHDGYLASSGQPILIDFEESIFTPEVFIRNSGIVFERPKGRGGIGQLLQRLIYGGNRVAAVKVGVDLVRLVRATTSSPRVLVIGGGTIGSGLQALYATADIEIIGTDVYASQHTALICDAHALPFVDASFDGVVIQAVLEHVLEPQSVADEIHRILRPGGVVYADTPFIQQVHEAAYDFTRFTHSGHRWLFRRFEELDSGPVNGSGLGLIWSIAYFLRSFGIGPRLVALGTAPFFWLRFLERRASRGGALDAAGGVYFLGTRSDRTLRANEMPAYYDRSRSDDRLRP